MSIVAVHGPYTFGSKAIVGNANGSAYARVNPTDSLKWTLVATDQSRPAVDYDWTYTGTSTAGPASPIADTKSPAEITFSAGQHTVTFTLGGVAQPSFVINAVSGAGAQSFMINVEGGPESFSFGTDEYGTGHTNQWDFGDGNTASAPVDDTVDHTYGASGDYDVSCTCHGNTATTTVTAVVGSGGAMSTLNIARVLDSGSYYYVLQWDPADYTVGQQFDTLLAVEPGAVGSDDQVYCDTTNWNYFSVVNPSGNVGGSKVIAKGPDQVYTLTCTANGFGNTKRLCVITPTDVIFNQVEETAMDIKRVLDSGSYYYILQWDAADYTDMQEFDTLLTVEPGVVGGDEVYLDNEIWDNLMVLDSATVVGSKVIAKGSSQVYTMRFDHNSMHPAYPSGGPRLVVLTPTDITYLDT